MKKIGFIFFMAAMLSGHLFAAQSNQVNQNNTPTLVITDVNLLNIYNGEWSNRTVMIEEGLITSIGSAIDINDYRFKPDLKLIDGRGRYLIPGLWDLHVHLVGDTRLPLNTFSTLLAANGVTSVRDTAGPLPLILKAREKLAQTPLSPNLYIAGHMVDGSPRVFDGSNLMFPAMGEAAANPEQAREMVDALAEADVNFIKAYEMLNPDTFAAVIDQAKQYGLPVTAHVPLSMTVSDAAKLGVNGMEHLRNLELECSANREALLEQRRAKLAEPTQRSGSKLRNAIYPQQREEAVATIDNQHCLKVIELLAKQGVAQVPTLSTTAIHLSKIYQDPEWLETFDYLPPKLAKQWRGLAKGLSISGKRLPEYRLELSQWFMDIVRTMQMANVPIMTGTDSPVLVITPGFALHLELGMLVEAGLSELQALQAATINPAQWFGVDGHTGSIGRGMHADLVLLNDNPLDDIAHTRNIEAVIIRGELFDREQLDQALAELLPAAEDS